MLCRLLSFVAQQQKADGLLQAQPNADFNMKNIAPYGSWSSTISAHDVSVNAESFSEPQLHPEGIFWLERRPAEKGRQVIMQECQDGTVKERLPSPYSTYSKVHEYGGGCYGVVGQDIYFVQMNDQRIYRIRGGRIKAVTPAGSLRFADLYPDPSRPRLYAVCEDHSAKGEPENLLVAVDVSDHAPADPITKLARGQDFYAAPRPGPDGQKLAWLSWNHPNMPWDQTELWLADLDNHGLLKHLHKLAGGNGAESLLQPEWSKTGQLHAISDSTGWWNLYQQQGEQLVHLLPRAADFGSPLWQFGRNTYGCLEDGTLLCTCHASNGTELMFVKDGQATQIQHPFDGISQLQVQGKSAVFIAGHQDRPATLVAMDCEQQSFRAIKATEAPRPMDKSHLSQPESISFPSQNQRIAYGYFYKPFNPDFAAPAETRPPLIVMSHGGPTAATGSTFDLEIQFWTSRGFAVVDVNYGGSSSYGRAYRDSLKGQWGVVDVDDCAAAAQYLVERGDADAQRLCIRGSSAGGYTTLAALTFRDLFKVGASYYGIGDLETLAVDTHKFESRYLDSLIGPYPECRSLYVERSPVHHADKLSCPVIFFQGLKDQVVPPAQAETMAQLLEEKGITVACIFFEEEAHGFRQSANIIKALESELVFYGKVLGFTPAGELAQPTIRNLPS